MKPSIVVIIILAVIGLFIIPNIRGHEREQSTLDKVKGEVASAIAALNGSEVSTDATRNNCVGTETGSHSCSGSAEFTTTLNPFGGVDGWKSALGGQLQNDKYPDCRLSRWDRGSNSYYITCDITWD